ncbi:hypothetical protein BKA04_001770 [Cryobacterium mesophilum]|uniref:Uncharacterized protein n=1 Tax=Terrimesophilobacter mesophilus TaxID=433647 RepID=A0A4R8VAI0_9MICO|nr:hypothetical protein [Terrimesophilobacter mesophilus]MBB5633547.1 hypothetical protein [Terrimesophilobacter mesophilus]TFB80251.1 hypothetical protein E3N84_09545 [Terrimesophilobacter mesophilus]
MRLRSSIPLTIAGGTVLALAIAAPALALTRTWTSPTDASWSVASWGGGVPVAGDDVTFDGGPRSTYDLGNLTFGTFTFLSTHEVANGTGSITLHSGLNVLAPSVVRIDPLLSIDAPQVWSVEQGAELSFPSAVKTDGASALTLDIEGTMTIEATGNLDALATGCVIKDGSGLLRLLGGGGGMGTCAGDLAGLDVKAGEVAIVGSPNLGGKDFAVTGGALTGGTDSTAAVVHSLSLAAAGVLSPGATNGDDIGKIDLWGTSNWTGGTYQVDWDATAADSDYVHGANQAISVNGTKLDVRLAGSPSVGDAVKILGSDISYTGQFSSPEGVSLADGDEFTSNGQIYSIEYITQGAESGVLLHWLRAAPVPPPAPALADTGVDSWPVALGAFLVIGVGALLAARRRLRLFTTRRP